MNTAVELRSRVSRSSVIMKDLGRTKRSRKSGQLVPSETKRQEKAGRVSQLHIYVMSHVQVPSRAVVQRSHEGE